MLALFNHPDQRRRLQHNLDGLLPTAVEEMLRYVSPVIYMRRTAMCDIELGGKKIQRGRQSRDVLRLGESRREHVSRARQIRRQRARPTSTSHSAAATHFCLGSHIARVEIQVMLREIMTRLPDIEPVGRWNILASNFISGPSKLPVRFTAKKRLMEEGLGRGSLLRQ